MDISLQIQAIKVIQQPAEQTQFIATPYNDAKLFLSAIPTQQFDNTLIPTGASYKLKLSDQKIYEFLANNHVTILVHAIQVSKKSKAGEYSFAPICGYVQIPLARFLDQVKVGRNKLTCSESQKIVFHNTQQFGEIELQFDLLLDFQIQQLMKSFTLNLTKLKMFGNLKNLQSFPSYNWECQIIIKDHQFVVCRNGYLQKAMQEEVAAIETVSDILNMQTQTYQLVFEESYKRFDQKALERGIAAYAEAIQDPKNVDKYKQTEIQSQSQKLIQALNSQLNLGIVPPKSKDPVPEHSLHAAVLYLKEQLTSMYQSQDKTGKLKVNLVCDAVDVQTFPLITDEYPNLNFEFYLTQQELRDIRAEKCVIQVSNELLQNSAAIYEFDLGPYLRERDTVKLSGLVLKMTEDQLSLISNQQQSLAASLTDTKAKTTTKGKDVVQLYQNALVTNYSVVDIIFDFNQTGISLSQQEIRNQFEEQMVKLHLIYQSIRNKKPICKNHSLIQKSLLENYLPPCKADMDVKQQILDCFRQEIINIYGSQADEAHIKDSLQKTMRYYNSELLNQQPDSQLTERHAILMNNVKLAIDQFQVHKNTVDSLLNAAEQLKNEPQNAIALYGQALVRERAQMGNYITSKNLERSLIGLLVSSIGINDMVSVERQLIRIISVARQAEIKSVRLLIFSVNMLIQLAVDYVFIISFINEFSNVLEFQDTMSVEEIVYPKLLLLLCFEQLNFGDLVDELRFQLAAYTRKQGSLLTVIDDESSNYYICELLKLGMCEELLLNGFANIPELVIQNVQFEQLFNEKQIVLETLVQHQIDNGECQCEKCRRQTIKQTKIQMKLEDKILSFKTKTAIIQARIFYCQGTTNNIKNVLMKSQFSVKNVVQNNVFSILSYLQTEEELKASYMDVIEPQLDVSCPGLLFHLGMVGIKQHRVPNLLVKGNKLSRILVCGAIQGRLPNKTQISLDTIAVSKDSKEIHKNSIPGMVISDEAYSSLTNLNAHSILFNSKVCFDMLLQAFCASQLSKQQFGRFDCSVLLGFDILKDDAMLQELCRCAVRYLPMFEILKFPIPYGVPSNDEFNVSKRIYMQLEPWLRSPPEHIKEQFSFTNDYLSVITPQQNKDILDLITPLVQQLLKTQFSSSNCSTYGFVNLMRNQQQLAFGCFQKALQMCSTTPTAWIGLAVCFATQILETKDKIVQEKLRSKIVECIGRVKLDYPFNQQALMAIAGSLLDPCAEKATLFAVTAQKLMKIVQPLPQISPVVIFQDVALDVDFSRQSSFMSLWHERRLQAIAAISCGRPFEVAQFLEQSLNSLAGIKPGRGINEIAQRILLMIEASSAYQGAGLYEDADRVMNGGLH